MPTIHFVDGEKGGVGKSLFCRVMVQYCLDKGHPFTLVEADRTNPDVGEFYPEDVEDKNGKKIVHYKQAIFSESERKLYEADKIFELALAKPVIVNLPAQVFTIVNDWMERNTLLDVSSQHGIDICKWFVCTGGFDSVKLFVESVNHFEGKIRHILVRNLGLQDDWSHVYERKELKDLMSKYSIKAIDLPKFSYRERDYIDEYRISFAQARELKELGVLGLQRIHKFLKEAYANIDQTEVWSKPVKSTRSASKSSKSNALAAATAETPATDAQAVVSGK
jgi:hypothetical protein